MANDKSPYRFGRGGPGVTPGSQLEKDLDTLSDAAKAERKQQQELEDEVGPSLRAFKKEAPFDKLTYLRRRAKELENRAAEMDKAKNSEAARTYRRAAVHARMRARNLETGGRE